MTTKKDFLARAKAASLTEEIDLPGMKEKVFVHTLDARSVRKITESCLKPGADPTKNDSYDDDLLTQRIVAASVVDSKGERLIPEGREAEIDDLPSSIEIALKQAAMRVNGMRNESGNS